LRTEKELEALLTIGHRDDMWAPPIVKTVATADTGTEQLASAIDAYKAFLDEESGRAAERRLRVAEQRIVDLLRERLVRDALERSRQAARPGVTGRELHALVCDLFEAAGHRTQRSGPGDDPREGFQFSLGHGVGLAVHEDPSLGQTGRSELVPGDVVAVEPGLWQPGIGEVRFEDLLLITENGCETLTRYPYELSP